MERCEKFDLPKEQCAHCRPASAPVRRPPTKGNVFAAKYYGPCAAECGEKIEPGDQVLYEDGDLVHEHCQTPSEPSGPATWSTFL
jgi:hypothetical protein